MIVQMSKMIECFNSLAKMIVGFGVALVQVALWLTGGYAV